MSEMRNAVLKAIREIDSTALVTISPPQIDPVTIRVVYGQGRMQRDFYVDSYFSASDYSWIENIKGVIEHDIEVTA